MSDFFIDFSAGGGGSGSFASPWNRFALLSGVVAGDFIWLRRVSYTDTNASLSINLLPTNIEVVGWPLVGDVRYSARPAAARSAWDGDAGTYATIIHTPPLVSSNTNSVMVSLGLGEDIARTAAFRRLAVTRKSGAGVNNYASGVIGPARANALTQPVNITTERCALELDMSVATDSRIHNLGFWSSSYDAGGVSSAVLSWTDTASIFTLRSSNLTPANAIYVGTDISYNGVVLTLAFAQSAFLFYRAGTSERWVIETGNAVAIGKGVSGVLDRCSFTIMQASQSAWSPTGSSVQGPPGVGLLFNSCTFTVVGATPGTSRFACSKYRFNDCKFLGMSSVDVNSPHGSVSISALSFGTGDTGVASLSASASGALVRVANAAFPSAAFGDVDGGVSAGSAFGASTFLLRSVSRGTNSFNIRGNGDFILSDIDGVPGTYSYASPFGRTQGVAASRVGSAARYALRLTSTTLFGLPSSPPGFDDLAVVLQPGSNTITAYIAYGGFTTAPTTRDIWVEVEVPGSTGRTVSSGRAALGAALTVDTSTWNGLVGTVSFATCTVTLTTPISVVALVRVYVAAVSGIVYVDPGILRS